MAMTQVNRRVVPDVSSTMTRLALAFLLTATLSCSSAVPREVATDDIDRFVTETLRAIPEVPSVAVAVVRDGKPYLARVYGRDADLHTGYYIASSTKSYTGLACAILAARGQLDLDAPISKYLTELRSDTGKIALRQFLTHTSGISNDGIVFRTAYSGEHTPAQLIALLDRSEPGKPGFQYDNLGYVVASLVIERVTGKPWQRALDELVFAPLGMKETTAYMSRAARVATPYEITRAGTMEPLRFVKNDQMMHAAGGIVTTAGDLEKWLAANINESGGGIPAAAFAEAHKQQVEAAITRDRFQSHGYGLGWYQADYDGEPVLFHHGGFEGWRAHVSFMPQKKIGVAVVTNSGGQSRAVINLLAESIYDQLLGKPDTRAERLAQLQATLKEQNEKYLAAVAERAKRSWMLAHPNSAYAGVYENPAFGTLTIAERDGHLYASIAQLSSVLEAYTEPESARVEIVPGIGEVLRFTFDGEKANALKWGDDEFRRVR